MDVSSCPRISRDLASNELARPLKVAFARNAVKIERSLVLGDETRYNEAQPPYWRSSHQTERRDRKVAVAGVTILFLVHAANSARYTRNTTVEGSFPSVICS